ncbi:MAG TPA: dihydrolipoamide acetyltransferase family protein [Candidatus Methylomirabilis sp.]|nr:dihydrolipoamide acetyltransferase family protein [Candidatus Methylomirabilis sp.]
MATEVVMPKLGADMQEGKIVRWLKKEGDPVKKGEIIAEVETDKADIEMEAYASGVLRKILTPAGQVAPVGTPVAVIADEGEDVSALVAGRAPEAAAVPAAAPAPKAAAPAPARDEGGAPGRVKASPLARKLARARGVDLRLVQGSGPGGRVVRADIEQAAAAAPAAAVTAPRPAVAPPRPAPAPAPPAAPAIPAVAAAAAAGEAIPLTPIRRAIATRMVQSKAPVPHFYLTLDADMTRAQELRASLNAHDESLKLSFTDILLKACALTLPKHPYVNASFAGDKIQFHREVHVGIAVALEDGLITPVLRDVDKKGLPEIARAARDLAERARNRKMKAEELSGATFTISNLGMFGIEEFSAIIVPPEAAILAVGAIQQVPTAEEGRVAVRPRMRMTLSCDHRVIDGATGARFLADLKKLLEAPYPLLL